MTDEQDEEPDAAEVIVAQGEALLRVFRDPAKAAQKLAAFIAEKYPERVASAFWVTLTPEHERDKGVAIRVYQLPNHLLILRALLGARTAGLGVFTKDMGLSGMHVSIGVGAVAAYANPMKWEPIAAVKVSL